MEIREHLTEQRSGRAAPYLEHMPTRPHTRTCAVMPLERLLLAAVSGLVPAWLPRWQVREWVRVLEPLVTQRPLLLWKELGLWSRTIWGWNPGFLSHLLDDFSPVKLSEPACFLICKAG